MLFHDSPYVEKAIISSPGWYTFPDLAQTYPYGTAGIPYISSEQIKKYLSKPIILQLALGDTIRESFLRKTPEAERQGRNRMERGRSFWLYIHQLAASRGWECHWRKIEECGIGGADGVYFTYTEDKPISFNPFYTDDYIFDVEKKDSIKTLLLTLWKSEDDKVTKTESGELGNACA